MIPLFGPIAVLFALIMLRKALPKLAFAPIFLEIRDEGLWVPRFGLIPWAAIGKIEVKVHSISLSRKMNILTIEVTDLRARIRNLGWLSWLDWYLFFPDAQGDTLWLAEARFPVQASKVAALIQANLPRPSELAPTL